MKNEKCSVKSQIEEPNELGIQQIYHPRKVDEKGNPMKPKSSHLEL